MRKRQLPQTCQSTPNLAGGPHRPFWCRSTLGLPENIRHIASRCLFGDRELLAAILIVITSGYRFALMWSS